MKFTKLTAAFAVIAVVALVSCKKSRKDLIVNKWKFTESSEPDMKKEDMDKLILEFTKDGKYTVAQESGTYKLSDDEKYFIVTGESNKVDSNTIDELTSDKLKFTVKSKNITITAVPVAATK
ncbi:MAG: hypothetical protein ABJA78_18980 [Ferruginibacter sp.]